MPLTSKGSEIKNSMIKEYGEKKGNSVFYASKNAGKITGVDAEMAAPAAPPMSQLNASPSDDPEMLLGNQVSGDASDDTGSEQSGVGAESWVNGKKHSTGYTISTGDSIHSAYKGDTSFYGKGLDAVPTYTPSHSKK